MQRLSTSPAEHWSDKVMSVLREQQLEACQERLSRCAGRGLFDNITNEEAAQLYAGSYFAQERSRRAGTPDLEALRALTLESAAREAAFLSPREDNLVKRMVIGEGETVLDDWEDISAAEALIRRLWCVLRVDEAEDTATLCLQAPLCGAVLSGMGDESYPGIRQALFGFDAMLHALLYLSGFLHADVPARHFEDELKKQSLPADTRLIRRYLKSAFEYCRGEQEEMLLVHPGLYDPEHLLQRLQKMHVPEMHLTHEMMLGGMNEMLPEEVASSESMRGALHGAVRPDLDEKEALEDLRIMAKQGASLTEMREVLESDLCVLPTPRMLSALEQLHLQTVRWMGMPSAVLN